MKKVIETVCAGNCGRSPLMRLLAMRSLQEKGVQKLYDIDSSGTLVDQIDRWDFPYDEHKGMVTVALSEGRTIYSAEERAEIEQILRVGQGDLSILSKKAFDVFAPEERAYRDRAIVSFGLNPTLVQPAKQTVVSPYVLALITADQKTRDMAVKIYETAEDKPVIATISELAGMPEISKVQGQFNWDVYNIIAMEILERTPRAIDEVLKIVR